MRILIVGAGVAGLTLAGLLKQRGFQPEIVEKQRNISAPGHMMGIYPLGSRILYGLGLMPLFLERTVSSDNYMMCTGKGEVMHQFSLKQVFAKYGPNRSCTRGTLIGVLREGCADLKMRFATSITSIEQKGEKVEVRFSDETSGEYDLVVGADGVHSDVRRLVFTPDEYSFFETGWGGWVWWTDDERLQPGTAMEFWGSGNMLGIYPTEYRFGAFAISPTIKDKTKPYQGLRSDIRQSLSDLIKSYPVVFEQIPQDDRSDMVYWPLMDVRTNSWYKKRVVLVGDAAVGFLPTSDAGASMAMESAAVLADELIRVDNYRLEWALSIYQKRRQVRVQAAQDDSRSLAKNLFVKSAFSSRWRNHLLQRYSLKELSDSVEKFFEAPI